MHFSSNETCEYASCFHSKKKILLELFNIIIPSVVVRFRSSSGSRYVSHFNRIVPSETASLSTFPRPLQTELKRKPECLSEIISALVIHPDENFGESTLRVGSPDPHNACPLQSLLTPLQDTAQQRDFMIWSLPLFKRYNASNPGQVVTDESEYFYMSNIIIKRGDLGSFKENITYKSFCYEELHDPH